MQNISSYYLLLKKRHRVYKIIFLPLPFQLSNQSADFHETTMVCMGIYVMVFQVE
jgi:hypothetical protein